jgi:hypothetical protein
LGISASAVSRYLTKSWESTAVTCVGWNIRWRPLEKWSVSNWHNACSRC